MREKSSILFETLSDKPIRQRNYYTPAHPSLLETKM